MTINKNIFLAIIGILIISLYANFCFYSAVETLDAEIEQSKGRVQIYEEQILKNVLIVDSLKHVITDNATVIAVTQQGEKEKLKIIYREKNRIANLPLDSAIIVFATRYSK